MNEMQLRILNGARTVLFSRGYRAFHLEALSGELGIARKTIYNHFPGRDLLVEEVLLFDAGQWLERLTAIIDSPETGFVQKAVTVLEMSLQKLTERRAVFQEAPVVRRQAFRARDQRTFREVITAPIARLVSQGISDGYVRADFDPLVLTRVMLAMILGPIPADRPAGSGEPAAELLQEMIYMLSVGVLTELGQAELPMARRRSPNG